MSAVQLPADPALLPELSHLYPDSWRASVQRNAEGKPVLEGREKLAHRLLNMAFLENVSEDFGALEHEHLAASGAVCSTYSAVATDPLEEEGARTVGCYLDDLSTMRLPTRTIPVHRVLGLAVDSHYRRRGIASSLMNTRLVAAKQSGAVLSLLTASEATIYRRFGYALMNTAQEITVEFGEQGLEWLSEPTGTCVRADIGKIRPLLKELEESMLAGESPISVGSLPFSEMILAGLTATSNPWVRSADPSKQQYALVHRDENGTADGLLIYQIRVKNEKTEARVYGCLYRTVNALCAMWSELSRIDLLTRATASTGHLYRLLSELVVDRSKIRFGASEDMFWGRILDVPAYLGALEWCGSGELLLKVTDAAQLANTEALLRVVNGQLAIETNSGTQLDSDQPEITLGVADLLKVTQGRIGAESLVSAGLATESRGGAVLLDSLLKPAALHPGYWF